MFGRNGQGKVTRWAAIASIFPDIGPDVPKPVGCPICGKNLPQTGHDRRGIGRDVIATAAPHWPILNGGKGVMTPILRADQRPVLIDQQIFGMDIAIARAISFGRTLGYGQKAHIPTSSNDLGERPFLERADAASRAALDQQTDVHTPLGCRGQALGQLWMFQRVQHQINRRRGPIQQCAHWLVQAFGAHHHHQRGVAGCHLWHTQLRGVPSAPARHPHTPPPGEIGEIAEPIAGLIAVERLPGERIQLSLPNLAHCRQVAASVELRGQPLPASSWLFRRTIQQSIHHLTGGVEQLEVALIVAQGQMIGQPHSTSFGRLGPFAGRGFAKGKPKSCGLRSTPDPLAGFKAQGGRDREVRCPAGSCQLPTSQGLCPHANIPEQHGFIGFAAERAVDMGRGNQQPTGRRRAHKGQKLLIRIRGLAGYYG